MSALNFRREISATMEEAIERTTAALLSEGFGILTQINFHQKVREKLGKEIRPVVILGACSPGLAYAAYLRVPEVAAVLPCNAVVSELGSGKVSIEFAKPSVIMGILGDSGLTELAGEADIRLQRALERI